MTTEISSLDEAILELVKLPQRLGARSVEFGWEADGDPDHTPADDEEVTWWAKAIHRGGPAWIAEVRGPAGSKLAVVRTLADLGRKMGGSIRIRVVYEGEEISL